MRERIAMGTASMYSACERRVKALVASMGLEQSTRMVEKQLDYAERNLNVCSAHRQHEAKREVKRYRIMLEILASLTGKGGE